MRAQRQTDRETQRHFALVLDLDCVLAFSVRIYIWTVCNDLILFTFCFDAFFLFFFDIAAVSFLTRAFKGEREREYRGQKRERERESQSCNSQRNMQKKKETICLLLFRLYVAFFLFLQQSQSCIEFKVLSNFEFRDENCASVAATGRVKEQCKSLRRLLSTCLLPTA